MMTRIEVPDEVIDKITDEVNFISDAKITREEVAKAIAEKVIEENFTLEKLNSPEMIDRIISECQISEEGPDENVGGS